MKSLIVSTCKHIEHELEFVRPLLYIFKNAEVKKYYEKIDFEEYDLIIISGTGLLDFDYLNYTENFKKLKDTDKFVVGICAGLQILGKVYSLELKDYEIIGKKEIKTNNGSFYGFFLTTKVLNNPGNFEVLGWYEKIPVFLKYKNTYLFSFHPEVSNVDILEKIKDKIKN